MGPVYKPAFSYPWSQTFHQLDHNQFQLHLQHTLPTIPEHPGMTGTVQEMHSIKKNVKTLEIIRASYTEVYYKIQDTHTTKFCFQLAQPKLKTI